MDDTRTFGEDLLLAVLNDNRGTIVPAAVPRVQHSLAGAVIMDLILRGRLTMNGRALVVSDTTSTGDDLLDQAPGRIASARRVRSVQHWMWKLSLMLDHVVDAVFGRTRCRETPRGDIPAQSITRSTKDVPVLPLNCLAQM
jgi:hypothetical protein